MTSTETLIEACKELAATVQCDDGVANSVLFEIAERLEKQDRALQKIHDIVFGDSSIFASMNELTNYLGRLKNDNV
jgi:precorrin-4 methylase